MNGTATTEPQARVPRPRTKHELEQARRRRNRLLPLLAVALVAFIAGVVVAAGSPKKDSVTRFVQAWAKQDFTGMEKELNESSAAKHPVDQLASAYFSAQKTATATAIDPGDVDEPKTINGQEVVVVGMKVRTELFGVVEGQMAFPWSDDGIEWEPHLTFPGLNPGEVLARHLVLSDRAAILTKNGTPLAEGQGADRSSPIGSDALDVAGDVGQPDADLAGKLQSEGYPPDVEVGISGLELAFNKRLAGKPGGQLLAVTGTKGGDVPASTKGRVLATAQATPGQPIHTTIDPKIQEATVNALYGGIAAAGGGAVVLDAKNGNVLAMAGSAYSAPAPPGSTFKMVTTTAALEAKVVKLSDSFEPTNAINVGGRDIHNSNDEICGGTFVQSFAESCNTVFAPLGPKIGEERLVDTAERYGFNEEPELFNKDATEELDPPEPSIPTSIGDDLDLGVSAIGQGKVLSTPLEMAEIAQTIGNGGMRSPNAIVTDPGLGPSQKPVKVTDAETAGIVRALMENVVNSGTGVRADMGRIQVAGKTGTAELGPKPSSEQPESVTNPGPGQETVAPEQIIDAWFACFAPSRNPKLVVAVFVADSPGDGGEVAAPIARSILESSL